MSLWRLGGVALCVGLAGCVRLNPSYADADTESGAEGRTSTTADSGKTQGETQTSITPGSSTTASETDDRSTSGPIGSDEATSESDSSTRPDPVDCVPVAACGPGFGPCPPGSACNTYRVSDNDWVAGGCFPIGTASLGEPCEPACGEELPRCGEGLMCAAWREDPTCLDRCGSTDPCGLSESCYVPPVLGPTDGGCEPPTPCELLLQDCPRGEACVPVNSSGVCFPGGGKGVEGEPCEFLNACSPGLLCTPTPACPGGATQCCMRVCDQAEEPSSCTCEDLGVLDQPSAGVCTTFP